MNIQEARQAGFEKFLAEQKKWVEEENLEPLTATEIGSMIRAWNAALDGLPEVSSGKSLCPCGDNTCLLHAWPPRTSPEVEKLKAEVEALRKDAERYRWITENADVDCRGHVPDGDYGSLCERIDAVMLKEQPK